MPKKIDILIVKLYNTKFTFEKYQSIMYNIKQRIVWYFNRRGKRFDITMFKIGDNIAYPMQGAGTIVEITDEETEGEVHSFYHVELSQSNLKIMVPVKNSEKVGVRPLIGADEIDKVLGVLKSKSEPMPSNWNRRDRANREKLQTGDIYIAAGVVRDLVRRDRKKRLSTGERKLLGTAKQILESEIALAGGYTMTEADKLVESHI